MKFGEIIHVVFLLYDAMQPRPIRGRSGYSKDPELIPQLFTSSFPLPENISIHSHCLRSHPLHCSEAGCNHCPSEMRRFFYKVKASALKRQSWRNKWWRVFIGGRFKPVFVERSVRILWQIRCFKNFPTFKGY